MTRSEKQEAKQRNATKQSNTAKQNNTTKQRNMVKQGSMAKQSDTSEQASAAKEPKETKAKREKKVNEPKQKRSIETRNKILEVGSMLMLQKGYHNVTTDDVAKAAGLSTGIVYHYFKDKKDILLVALELRANAMFEGFAGKYAQAPTVDFEVFLNSLFDFLMDYHKKFWIIHEELESLYHSDAEIAATIDDYWQKTYRAITEIYVQKSGKPEHAAEKVRIALDLIEDYCHACMHPIVETLDQDYLRQSVISLVKNLLT